MKQPRVTILDFHRLFPDNETCLRHLFKTHHGTVKCPRCGRGSDKFYLESNTSRFICGCGGHKISPKAGTIFEKSDTDLVKWFFAIFLFAQSRNGVAAKELERQLGVTYKTAWRMGKEIRKLMAEDPSLLTGEVEVDDTYVGGRRKGKRGRGAAGKTVVFGAVQRDGKVQTSVVPNVKAATVLPLFKDSIAKGTRLISDELWSYKKVARILGLEHRTVEHGDKEYAKPDGTHTNTIEGFWSQLKRSLDGTYHVVSPKYLGRYVQEFQFRYNRGRDGAFHLFDVMLSRVALPHAVATRRIAAFR